MDRDKLIEMIDYWYIDPDVNSMVLADRIIALAKGITPGLLDPGPCKKCGSSEHQLEYLLDDEMQVKCTRCWFQWTVPTLDAGKEDTNDG